MNLKLCIRKEYIKKLKKLWTRDIIFDIILVMSKLLKLIQKVMDERDVSYEDAENILLKLGFKLDIRGSHHVFRKNGYPRNIAIKRRSQLLPYQIRELKEILRDYGY